MVMGLMSGPLLPQAENIMVEEVRNIRRQVLPNGLIGHHRGDAAYPLGVDWDLDQDGIAR